MTSVGPLTKAEFDDFLALKKDSARGPDGIPYGAYRCAGGLGSQFLFQRLKVSVLEGGTVLEHVLLKVEPFFVHQDL